MVPGRAEAADVAEHLNVGLAKYFYFTDPANPVQ